MFQKYRFGMVKFDDREYSHDIVVHTDGNVKKRDKGHSKRKYGTSHILCADEIEILLDENPEVLVVGCGQVGVLKVGEDARKILAAKNVDLVDLPTQKATDEFNRLKNKGRRVAAIIHVTC